MADKRKCMFIDASQRFNPDVDTQGYVPSLVTEGEPGHSPMMGQGEAASPWFWGRTYDEACKTADDYNRRTFGIEPIEAWKIVASSMAVSRIR